MKKKWYGPQEINPNVYVIVDAKKKKSRREYIYLHVKGKGGK